MSTRVRKAVLPVAGLGTRMLPVAGFIGVSPDYNIHATAAIRNQPYARQKVPPTVCK